MEGCDPGGLIRIIAVVVTFLGLLAFFELEHHRQNLEEPTKKGKPRRKGAIRNTWIIQAVIAVVIIASNITFMFCLSCQMSKPSACVVPSVIFGIIFAILELFLWGFLIFENMHPYNEDEGGM